MSTQYLLSFSGNCTPSTLFSSPLPRPHNSDRITSHSPHPIYSGGVKGPGWTNHRIGSRSEQVLIWFLSGIIYVDVERELPLPSRVPRWDDGSLELLMAVILTSRNSTDLNTVPEYSSAESCLFSFPTSMSQSVSPLVKPFWVGSL